MNELNSDCYEADFVEWLDRQVTLLREKRLDQIDVQNIAEELSSMARSSHRELESRLETLITHLLKCGFQPERKSSSWLGTIREQRTKIRRLLRESPSLARRVEQYAADVYNDAVAHAVIETGLSARVFPALCPYTVSELLDVDFLP